MKKILTMAAAAFTLLTATAANGYHVTGSAEGTQEGDTVYLCQMTGYFNMEPLDTAVIKNGRFDFTGNFDGLTMRFVTPMHNGKMTGLGELLLENADIEMQIFADPEKKAVVKGGKEGELYREYEKVANVYQQEMDAPWQTANDTTATQAERDKAQQILDSLNTLHKAYVKNFIIAHIPSAASDMLYAWNSDMLAEKDKKHIEELLDKEHHYYYYAELLKEKAADAATAVGQKYTDLAMPDTKGKTMRLSQYIGKNKYTLVDFWASWCGPCRAEMPNVVKAYNTYHEKGFDVIGVSFDNNKAAWTKAIAQLKMPWHHMSDLKGWGSAAAAAYNVKGIPANVLIDRQGTIVAKDLREEALQEKLAELLK